MDQIRGEIKITSDLRELERELSALFAQFSKKVKLGVDFSETLKDIEKFTSAMTTLDTRIKDLSQNLRKAQAENKKLADASQKYFTQPVKNALATLYGSQKGEKGTLEEELIRKHKSRLLREAHALGQQMSEAHAAGMAKGLAQKDIHQAVLLALGPLADTREQQAIQAKAQQFFRGLKPGKEFTQEMRVMLRVLLDARSGIQSTQKELDALANSATKSAKVQKISQQSLAQGYKELAKIAGDANRNTTALATAQAKQLADYMQRVRQATQLAHRAAQHGAYDPNLQRSASGQIRHLGGMISSLRSEQIGGMMTAAQSAHADRQILKAEELIRKWQNDIMPSIAHIRSVKGSERTRRSAQMGMWDVEGRVTSAFQQAKEMARENIFDVNPTALRALIQDLVKKRAVYRGQATRALGKGDDVAAQQYQMLATGLTSKIGSHGETLSNLEWQLAKAGAGAMGAPGGFVNLQAQGLATGVGGLRAALDRAKISQLGGGIAGSGSFQGIRAEYASLERYILDGQKRLADKKKKLSIEERAELDKALKEAIALQTRYQQELERLRVTDYNNIQKHRKNRRDAVTRSAKEELEIRKKQRLEENLEMVRGTSADPTLVRKMNRDQLSRLNEALNESRWARRRGYQDVPDVAVIDSLKREMHSRERELGKPNLFSRFWYGLTGMRPMAGGAGGGGGGAHAYGNLNDTLFHNLNKRVTNISQMLGTSLYGMGLFGAGSALAKGTIGAAAEKESMVNTLGGLINTFAKFRDATGKTVGTTENFVRAIEFSGKVYDEVRAKAADSILTTKEMFDYFMSGAPQLMARGLNTKQSLDIVTAIASLGKSMGLSSTAVQSDIRDLATGQVTVRSQVLRTMGFDKTALGKARQQGPEALVAYFNKIMDGFAPALRRLSTLNQTAITRLMNALQQFGITIGEKMAPRLIPLLARLQAMFEKWATDGTIDKFASSFGQTVEAFAKSLMWFMETLGPTFADIRVLFAGFLTFMTGKFLVGLALQTQAVQTVLNNWVVSLGSAFKSLGAGFFGLTAVIGAFVLRLIGYKNDLQEEETQRNTLLARRSGKDGYTEEEKRKIDANTADLIAKASAKGMSPEQISALVFQRRGYVSRAITTAVNSAQPELGDFFNSGANADTLRIGMEASMENVDPEFARSIMAETYASVLRDMRVGMSSELLKLQKTNPMQFIKRVSALYPDVVGKAGARLALANSVDFLGRPLDLQETFPRETAVAGLKYQSGLVAGQLSRLDAALGVTPDSYRKAVLAAQKYGLTAQSLGYGFQVEQQGFAKQYLDAQGKPDELVKLGGEIIESQQKYKQSLAELQSSYEEQIRTMRESIMVQKDELQTRKENLDLQKAEFDLNQRKDRIDRIDRTSAEGRATWTRAMRSFIVDQNKAIDTRTGVVNAQANRQIGILQSRGDSWEVVAKQMGVSSKAPVSLEFNAKTVENLQKIGEVFNEHKAVIVEWSKEMKTFGDVLDKASKVNADTATVIQGVANTLVTLPGFGNVAGPPTIGGGGVVGVTGGSALTPMPRTASKGAFFGGVWVPPESPSSNKASLKQIGRSIALEFGIDPDIFEKQIQQESSWNPRSKTWSGDKRVGYVYGLGQLSSNEMKDVGVTDPYDPVQNMRGLATLMKRYLTQYGGDYAKALMRHFQGGPTPKGPLGRMYLDRILGPGHAGPLAPMRVDAAAIMSKGFLKTEEAERNREAKIEADQRIVAAVALMADEALSRRQDYRQARMGWMSGGLGEGENRGVFLIQQNLSRLAYEYMNGAGAYGPGGSLEAYGLPSRMGSARRYNLAYEYFNLHPGEAGRLSQNPAEYRKVLETLGFLPSEVNQGITQTTAGGFAKLGRAIEEEINATVAKINQANEMIRGALSEFGNAISKYSERAAIPYQEAARLVGVNLSDIAGQTELDKIDRHLLSVRMSQIGLTSQANTLFAGAVQSARTAKPGDMSAISALLGFSFPGIGRVLSSDQVSGWTSKLGGITDPDAWQSALSQLFIEMAPSFGEKFAKLLADQVGPIEVERRLKELSIERARSLREDKFAYDRQVNEAQMHQEELTYQRLFDQVSSPQTSVRLWTDTHGLQMESVSRRYELLGQQAQLAMGAKMLADKKAIVGYVPAIGMYGMPMLGSDGKPLMRPISLYEKNISANPNYYEDFQNSLISSGRGALMGELQGMNLASMQNAQAYQSVAGNLFSMLIGNPLGVMNGTAFNNEGVGGLFSPLMDLQSQRQNVAAQLLMTAMFKNPSLEQALNDPTLRQFLKVVNLPGGGMTLKFDKWGAIKSGLGNLAGGLAGNYGGTLLGTALFPGRDPSAISLGANIGTSLGGTFASALGMAGPWGMVAGGLLGGLIGGLFGGSKPNPAEERRRALEKQHRERMEELLSRIDKSLRPQADYFRTIKGDVLYGTSSRWYSGRAYAQLGLQGALGGR
jgi:hypothetical protein